MSNNSKYPWFVFDMVVFLAVNIIMLWWIHPGADVIHRFSIWGIILLGLAVFRAADIISNESITAPLREPFVRHIHLHNKEVEKPLKFGFRGAMGSLLYCPSCTGVWVAMALVYGYLLKPGIFSVIIVIFAASALERLLTNLYYIERKAERSS